MGGDEDWSGAEVMGLERGGTSQGELGGGIGLVTCSPVGGAVEWGEGRSR